MPTGGRHPIKTREGMPIGHSGNLFLLRPRPSEPWPASLTYLSGRRSVSSLDSDAPRGEV
jgi:hypothetical protein